MDWEAISTTIREQKLSKEQGLKLIDDERKRVEAARLAEHAASKKAYEERKQLQEREIQVL